MHLGEHGRLVRNIHADMDHDGRVERPVVEGHGLTGRGQELGAVPQADPVTEQAGGLDELRGEVDPGHRGTGHGRHPRGAADPTADVEQSHAGRDAEAVEDVLARRRASGVQLVDRKQVRGPEVVDVDPRTGKRSKDDGGEILGRSVVAGDEIANVHAPQTRTGRVPCRRPQPIAANQPQPINT